MLSGLGLCKTYLGNNAVPGLNALAGVLVVDGSLVALSKEGVGEKSGEGRHVACWCGLEVVGEKASKWCGALLNANKATTYICRNRGEVETAFCHISEVLGQQVWLSSTPRLCLNTDHNIGCPLMFF